MGDCNIGHQRDDAPLSYRRELLMQQLLVAGGTNVHLSALFGHRSLSVRKGAELDFSNIFSWRALDGLLHRLNAALANNIIPRTRVVSNK